MSGAITIQISPVTPIIINIIAKKLSFTQIIKRNKTATPSLKDNIFSDSENSSTKTWEFCTQAWRKTLMNRHEKRVRWGSDCWGHLLGVWDILFRTTAARITETESDDAAPTSWSWALSYFVPSLSWQQSDGELKLWKALDGFCFLAVWTRVAVQALVRNFTYTGQCELNALLLLPWTGNYLWSNATTTVQFRSHDDCLLLC